MTVMVVITFELVLKASLVSPGTFLRKLELLLFIFYARFLTTYQLVCNISFISLFLSPEIYHRLISFSPDTRVAFGRWILPFLRKRNKNYSVKMTSNSSVQ